MSGIVQPTGKMNVKGHSERRWCYMEFIVEIDPEGKARPRFSQKSRTVYTPNKTKKYEKRVRAAFLESGGETIPAGCYVAITVDAYFRIPKSYTKGKRLACQHNVNRPAKKPDIDNVLKAVMDALNGAAYVDDKQVVSVTCRKYYAAEGEGYIKVNVREDKV